MRSGLGLGVGRRRPAIAEPGWLPPGVAWAADFAADRYWITGGEATPLAALITTGGAAFTRASAATYRDAGGVSQVAASDVPRFDHLGAVRALLIEPQRTNLVPNGDAAGAVAGSPGTPPTGWVWVQQRNSFVAGAGVQDGMPYVDLTFAGTDNTLTCIAGLTLNNVVPAVLGDQLQMSAYVALVSGSLPAGTNLQLQRVLYNSAVSSIGTVSTNVTIGGSLARLSLTNTVADASAAFVALRVVKAVGPASGAFAFTLRIGGVQIEKGAFPTTYVPTTAGAQTRYADALTLFPAPGTYDMTVAFADAAPQALPGVVVSGAGWIVPTNLAGRRITRIEAVAA